MAFAGLKKAVDRNNLITWLKASTVRPTSPTSPPSCELELMSRYG
jgi:hypothetical protein